MTPTETVKLTTYISQGCPQQAIDEYTADVWHDLLGEFRLSECITAARKIMTAKPFVAPCDIIAEVKRERRAELGRERVAALAEGRPLLRAVDGTVEVGPHSIAELA